MSSVFMGRFLFSLSVAVWLGAVVSFSYVFLPLVHTTLEGSAKHTLLQRMFPRYYVLGTACGLLAVAVVSLWPTSPMLPTDERLRLAAPVTVAILCTVAAQNFLLPRLSAATLEEDSRRFDQLHRISAMLNTTVLAMLILAAAAIVIR